MYCPAGSCHPSGCLDGLISGETIRTMRTNSTQEAFNTNYLFLKQKLAARGFTHTRVDRIRNNVLNKQKVTKPAAAQKARRNFLVLPWSRDVNIASLRKAMARRRVGASIGLAFTVQRSLFRQMYSLNWLHDGGKR